tara:strand:+ start:3191 stop:5725 length:2535 start_codon:yes stop_codon:yes gene_type:complete
MKHAEKITKRELEVLRLISHEYTTSEIAHKLFISNHTATSHRKNLLSKMKVKNTAGLVRKAFLANLLTLQLVLFFCFSSIMSPLFGQTPLLDVDGTAKIDGLLQLGHHDDSTSLFIGYLSGYSSHMGHDNTFVGFKSGEMNSSGMQNSIYGSFSGQDNTSGFQNSFFGYKSGNRNTIGDRNSFFGSQAGNRNTSGRLNTFIGYLSGFLHESGIDNSFLGAQSGNSRKNGTRNTFLGASADVSESFLPDSIDRAIAIGYNAQVGCHNCAVIGGTGVDSVNVGIGTSIPQKKLHVVGDVLIEGNLSAVNDSDSTSTYWGFLAGDSINTGELTNTFFGSLAGASNKSGFSNSFFGQTAGMSNQSGRSNSFFGHESGMLNTSGKWNSFFGESSGLNNSEGDYNVFLGYSSGKGNKTGNYNTTIGYDADLEFDSLEYAIAIGSRANVECDNCAVIGGIDEYAVNLGIGTASPEQRLYVVGESKIVGTLDLAESIDSTSLIIGRKAGVHGDFSSVRNNTFTGYRAGMNNVIGEDNTYYGSNTGVTNTDDNNSFFGSSAGLSSQGGNNTYIGASAGFLSLSGEYNTFIGSGAGVINVRGDNNVFIGANAGMNVVTDSLDNAIAIGRNAKVDCSDCAVVGNSSTNLGIGTQSPQATIHSKTTATDTKQQLLLEETTQDGSVRIKFLNANVDTNSWSIGTKPLADGNSATAVMNFLYSEGGNPTSALKLFGDGNATLTGTLTENSDIRLKTNINLLAQVLPKLLLLNGYSYNWKNKSLSNESQIGLMAQEVESLFPELIRENPDGHLAVSYTRFVPLLIEGMKEQQNTIEKQQKMIETLLVNQKKILERIVKH